MREGAASARRIGHHIKLAGTAKKKPQALGCVGPEVQVSTTNYCIHIPRVTKGAAEWLGIFRPVNEFEDTNVG